MMERLLLNGYIVEEDITNNQFFESKMKSDDGKIK